MTTPCLQARTTWIVQHLAVTTHIWEALTRISRLVVVDFKVTTAHKDKETVKARLRTKESAGLHFVGALWRQSDRYCSPQQDVHRYRCSASNKSKSLGARWTRPKTTNSMQKKPRIPINLCLWSYTCFCIDVAGNIPRGNKPDIFFIQRCVCQSPGHRTKTFL